MGSANVTLYGKWTPAGINFHITNPKTGDTLAWGAQFTFKWTLPADNSIDTVVLYRKTQDQPYEALNLYFPVVSPTDSLDWNIGSDVPAGQSLKFQIRNKADSTESDEITIVIKQ
jgi:hypothetical protein